MAHCTYLQALFEKAIQCLRLSDVIPCECVCVCVMAASGCCQSGGWWAPQHACGGPVQFERAPLFNRSRSVWICSPNVCLQKNADSRACVGGVLQRCFAYQHTCKHNSPTAMPLKHLTLWKSSSNVNSFKDIPLCLWLPNYSPIREQSCFCPSKFTRKSLYTELRKSWRYCNR